MQLMLPESNTNSIPDKNWGKLMEEIGRLVDIYLLLGRYHWTKEIP